jgi:tungstate transport system permease protein
MNDIAEGVKQAFQLLLSFDREVYGIILLSLFVSLTSTMISALTGIPLGIAIGTKDFRLKNAAVRLIYTFMSLPPVIAGLVVFLFLSRKGPLGFLDLIYSPASMIIAQTCLVMPIITGIVYSYAKEKGHNIRMIGRTLGANRFQTLMLLISELRVSILVAVATGLGRAMSEVGAVMIVGGNIKEHTRVMTTSIAMLNSMGRYDMAIALGMVLFLLAFMINSIIYHYQQGV